MESPPLCHLQDSFAHNKGAAINEITNMETVSARGPMLSKPSYDNTIPAEFLLLECKLVDSVHGTYVKGDAAINSGTVNGKDASHLGNLGMLVLYDPPPVTADYMSMDSFNQVQRKKRKVTVNVEQLLNFN